MAGYEYITVSPENSALFREIDDYQDEILTVVLPRTMDPDQTLDHGRTTVGKNLPLAPRSAMPYPLVEFRVDGPVPKKKGHPPMKPRWLILSQAEMSLIYKMGTVLDIGATAMPQCSRVALAHASGGSVADDWKKVAADWNTVARPARQQSRSTRRTDDQ